MLGVDLRVFVNGQIAQVSGSDLTDGGLERLAERAVGMAKYSPADPFAQLADPEQLATELPALENLRSGRAKHGRHVEPPQQRQKESHAGG